jgi:hypothetical protein
MVLAEIGKERRQRHADGTFKRINDKYFPFNIGR